MFWTLELASSLDDAPWPATALKMSLSERRNSHRVSSMALFEKKKG